MDLKSDNEVARFLELYSRFFNHTTTWTEIKKIYPKLISFLNKANINNSDVYGVIEMKYQGMKLDEGFKNIVQYLLIIWVIIFILGSISNGIVIFILGRVDNKSVYDIICVGLAVTDLLILIVVVPITTIWYSFQDYTGFSNLLCPFVNFIVYVALFSSATMLLTLTVTRFLAVVHPWKNRMISAKEARIACCVAWIVGGMCSIPVAFYFGVEDITKSNSKSNRTQVAYWTTQSGIKKCKDLFPNQTSRTIYFVLVFLLTYLLPFISIIIMNYTIIRKLRSEVNQASEKPELIAKSKSGSIPVISSREARKRQVINKVTKMVFLVTTLYCVCWLPTQLVNIWYYSDPGSFPKNRKMLYVKFISQTLSFASTCINPIVYSVVNETFKKAVKKQCPCIFRSTKSTIPITITSNIFSTFENGDRSDSVKKLQKPRSGSSFLKIRQVSKSKGVKADVIENQNKSSYLSAEPNNSKNNKNNLLKIDSKKRKKSDSPYIESQASCSVFSFEGFTDNLDSTTENVNYNLITKV